MPGLDLGIHVTPSFRRKPESSRAEGAKKNWTPAFAGGDVAGSADRA
jgi:hypothetical protein